MGSSINAALLHFLNQFTFLFMNLLPSTLFLLSLFLDLHKFAEQKK